MACFVVPFLCLWVATLISWMVFMFSVIPSVLQRWSTANKYEIVKKRTAVIYRGPFSWTSGPCHVVLRVAIRDAEFRSKEFWVRVGDWWWPRTSVEKCPIDVVEICKT